MKNLLILSRLAILPLLLTAPAAFASAIPAINIHCTSDDHRYDVQLHFPPGFSLVGDTKQIVSVYDHQSWISRRVFEEEFTDETPVPPAGVSIYASPNVRIELYESGGPSPYTKGMLTLKGLPESHALGCETAH